MPKSTIKNFQTAPSVAATVLSFVEDSFNAIMLYILKKHLDSILEIII